LREFESLREFFSSSTFLALIDLPFLLLFLLLIWYIGGPIVLVPLLAMPVLLGVTFFVERQARDSAEKSYRHNMQKNALLVEMVNGLETVKSAMAESRMQRLWEAVSGISAMASNRTRKYSNRIVNFSIFLTHMVTVSLVVWGVYRIGEGEMSLGGLIGCNILLGRTMAPLMHMATLLSRMQKFLISLRALSLLMELPSENQDEATCMDFGNLEGEFVLDRVSFTYPGATARSLDRVCLTIRPGEKVGIIGRMGSGKSTLSKLLIGLYTPQEGSVSFGGVDIRQLAVSDLRSRVGVLPQEAMLFYGTIRDNIALGDPTINDQLVRRAGILAGVESFVKRFPAGYGTQVGEMGRNLSGGQRQAVCLARALVRDPSILILDEPTSNMDLESEEQLQRTLAPLVREKTVILFTHRVRMLQLMDRLVVMNNGRIVMDGPRAEVMRKMQQEAVEKARRAARPGTSAAEAAANLFSPENDSKTATTGATEADNG
ncbi:MAG: ATP-binding cassette domain-containing protein, partial [Desulfovibrionaceae bacterium]|nr:ATP-binding cassette domain-containing protein [Desulfovibrionaceae bacterium]